MSERSGLYGGRGCILREATNYNGEAIHTHTPCHHDWAELSNVCSGCSQARPSHPIGSKDRHSTNSSHDGISIQPMELELMTAKRTQGPQFNQWQPCWKINPTNRTCANEVLNTYWRAKLSNVCSGHGRPGLNQPIGNKDWGHFGLFDGNLSSQWETFKTNIG